jgi:hypothetical protein
MLLPSKTAPAPPPPPIFNPPAPPPATITISTSEIDAGFEKVPELVKV